MSHIPADILDQIKQKLLEQLAKLKSVRQDVDQNNPIHDETRVDNNASLDTDAREEDDILRSEVVGTQVNEMLARIEAALTHIEDGTYGHTADGQEIPVERLLADPTATTLVQ